MSEVISGGISEVALCAKCHKVHAVDGPCSERKCVDCGETIHLSKVHFYGKSSPLCEACYVKRGGKL